MKGFAGALVYNALFLQLSRDTPSTISKTVCQIKYFLNGAGLCRIDLDIVEFSILFSGTSFFDQLIPIGGASTAETSLLYDLPQTSLGSYGGFQAFARCLPIPDVVHELVHMSIKPLLSFL